MLVNTSTTLTPPGNPTLVPQTGHSSSAELPLCQGRSDGMGLDKAGGKATLCGYATEQTTKMSPQDP